ncbi:hypothetical protein CFB45_09815 [Burkholderia sp. HI2500]|nr:hypothetical protein CFB45_09815 [Burkholderia sp. HI2500]
MRNAYNAHNVHDLPCQNGPHPHGAQVEPRAALHCSNGIDGYDTVIASLSIKRQMHCTGNAANGTHRGPRALRSF